MNLPPEHERGVAHRDLAQQIVAVAVEERMLPDVDDDVQIAGGGAPAPERAFAGQPQALGGGNAGGNLDRQLALAADPPLAVTCPARLGDDAADAAAVMAGPGHREEPLLHADLAVAMAVGAALRRAARRGPGPAAGVAGLLAGDLQGGLGAVRRLLERDLQVVAQVAAPPGAAAPAAAETEQIAEPAENVAEVVEDRRVDAGPAPGRPAHPGVAEPVVPAALLGVREHRIGLGRLLEPLLRGLVAGVAVRVVLEGELPVRALDVRVLRRAGDAENLVVVAGRHAFATLTIDGRSNRWRSV